MNTFVDDGRKLSALYFIQTPVLSTRFYYSSAVSKFRKSLFVGHNVLKNVVNPFISIPRGFSNTSTDSPRVSMTTQQQAATSSDSSINTADIGLIGLAVMGQNLALNIAEKGFRVSVYNRTSTKTDDTINRFQLEQKNCLGKLQGFYSLESFVRSLKRPRKVIIMVKAGSPVDATISTLENYLEPGDLIVDGGNEWYENTQRRAEALSSKGILYMGMGVSGGEDGARHGPSLMPGGPVEAWNLVNDILNKIAAQVDDGPCVTYIGPGGSGNYVKMVHNGIEYADMQLIGEVYDILRTLSQSSHFDGQLYEIFERWNGGDLQSFLIEITSQILQFKEKDNLVVDRILDQSGSKGTDLRVSLSRQLHGIGTTERNTIISFYGWNDFEFLISELEKALFAAKICCYAQGMALIQKASLDEQWQLDCGEIARIWKGGCIIRARFLDRIKEAYKRQPNLLSLLEDEHFVRDLNNCQTALRRVVSGASLLGIPVPALASALSYYDSCRKEILSSSQLIQAQRDFFGAHTYKRLDKEGVFHSRWSEDGSSIPISNSS
ncbi:6-phosphogluconate dehydrogenase, decarboxylating 1 [Galdieria sulphuraria]|nr:6-phosphogluconate dehydrogenase, decarboxylating 1 [Galdieria sulphuraria]